MARLSRADMEAALAFAAEVGMAGGESGRVDAWLMERIAGLANADVAAYSQYSSASELLHDVEFPGPPHVPSDLEEELFRTENPFTAYAERTRNPYIPALRLTDVVDMAVFRRTALWAIVHGDAMPHAIQTRMRGEAGTVWLLEVDRGGRNFTERDTLLVDALRPTLMVYESRRALVEMVEVLRRTPAHSETGAPLTRREREVLDLVASGATNAVIAERLWISPGTVKKHLEHIFAKLDVGSRTAAVARTGRVFSGDH